MHAKAAQRGNIMVYILITMFLAAMLVITLTDGPRKNATTSQLDDTVALLKADLDVIESSITDCAVAYPASVDVNGDGSINATDNPNPPFPLYNDLSSGGTGAVLSGIKCPGAPTADQLLYRAQSGHSLRMLGDTTRYTVTYLNDSTEGIQVRITRATSNPVWTEAISRVNGKYSKCKAAAVTAPGTCANGCFYMWLKRLSTSAIATTGSEAGCPPT